MEWPSFREEVFAGNWDAELVNNLLVNEGIPTIVAAAKSIHPEHLTRHLRSVYVLDAAHFERAKEIVERVRLGHTLKDPKTYRSWRCKTCNELVEGQFEVCWKCGTAKPG